jgi:D-alanyl-D-alanine carboxypeptidase/D-alanyl-D-alanine-endopeptidase (penicillin-binding protein 4)
VASSPALGVRSATTPPLLASTASAWASANPATSVLVWRLDAGEPVEILNYKADVPRRPASTMKVVTAASALLTLSPDFRFETRLYAAAGATQNGTTLTGPLYLKGYGDPTLATAKYARRYLGIGGGVADLVRPLRDTGVRAVNGPVVVDETFFDSVRRGPTWPSRYATECPPLSAITVNQGYLGDRRAAYVKNPPKAAGAQLRIAMKSMGLTQTGPVRAGRAPAQGRLLATHDSPPLRAITRMMLPDSDNFLAEMLTKAVGAYGRSDGSTAGGTAHAVTVLSGLGLLGPSDRLVDGSGLAVENRLTARSLVRVLSAADNDPTWGEALISSLAKGGEGTLKRRLRGPQVGDRVRAKTGYIRNTSTLAGLVDSPDGARYAFAILMNQGSVSGAHATQDRIVTLLATGVADNV